MSKDLQLATGLYLVTPPAIDLSTFPASLEAALTARDIAAVLIAGRQAENDLARVAEALVPIIQRYNSAALIEEDRNVADRTGADGVHVAGDISRLRTALEQFHPQRIVGAGAMADRHSVMLAAEAGVDYVFFGRPHGDIRPEPHPNNIALAEWWSAIFEIPAVIMAGNDIESVADAAATGAEFVAVHAACWNHENGPAAAITRAHEIVATKRKA